MSPDRADLSAIPPQTQDWPGTTAELDPPADHGESTWTGRERLTAVLQADVKRLDRLITRLRESGVERAICFGHGHCLRTLTLRWLGLDVGIGEQFPLGTGTVSVLGWAKQQPALERWNSRP